MPNSAFNPLDEPSRELLHDPSRELLDNHSKNPLGNRDNPMIRLPGRLFSQTISKEEKIKMLPKEFNIAVTETISQEVTTMCNLSAGIYSRGMQKGRQEGIVTGEKNKALEIAKTMIQNGLAPELIVKCTGLTLTDVDALKAQAAQA